MIKIHNYKLQILGRQVVNTTIVLSNNIIIGRSDCNDHSYVIVIVVSIVISLHIYKFTNLHFTLYTTE
jgi:hypothetical protein